MSALDEVGRIPADYRHVAKLAVPGPPVRVEGTVLKWYEVAPADAPVPEAIRTLARSALEDASAAWELELSADIGFAILHRCGHDFYFLLICTWRNQNEVWETVSGQGRRLRCGLPAVADGRAAPAHVLRLGARRRLPRGARVGALPAHRP